MDAQLVLTVLAIISPILLSLVWAITTASKISNRALLLEISIKSHGERITKIEKDTSYSSLEAVVQKVCFQVFNSKEFKESMMSCVKDTLLHVEKNRSVSQAGAFEEILFEIKQMHSNLITAK
jgi:hypothetical protein